MKIMGTPTSNEIKAMNPKYQATELPERTKVPWTSVLRNHITPDVCIHVYIYMFTIFKHVI